MDERGLSRRISEAFCGGECRRRELRLERWEAEFLAAQYGAKVSALGQNWYEISFGGVEHG